ncbi:MAG: metal-dependent transcriptional regulator [Elusimicrobia bacterium]|nr:metal-dependent transcriptional regulator [Elusimicrobiota bacterium]
MTDKTRLISKKFPIPTAQQENLEQAVSVIWQLADQGQQDKKILEAAIEETVGESVLEGLFHLGLAEIRSEKVCLTEEGSTLARHIVRRHRLTERLLKDILDMPLEQLDPNACRLEHVITQDVEDAICTLLGHPSECPHGLPVPDGRCCQSAQRQTGPVVIPVLAMSTGQEGRIAYLAPADRPELHKLMSLGFVPGATIRVGQVSPAYVISVGHTMAAIDSSLAGHIFVRKKNSA